jgi:hypothetical protein
MDVLSSQAMDWNNSPESGTMSKTQEKRLTSLKFLVENDIINPSYIFTAPHDPEVIMSISSEHEIILTKFLGSYCGWEYELQRVDYIFGKTSLDLIRDFRDEYGASVGHAIFYANGFPPEKIAEKWFWILEEAKFDWFCETKDEKQNLLILAVSRLESKWLDFFIKKGLDPNCVWGEDRRCANCLQYMLYNRRYMKKSEHLEDVTRIAELLVNAGINMTYTDSDGRSVMDYIHRYGWNGTDVYKIIRAVTDVKVTGNIPTKSKYDWGFEIRNVDRDSMSPEMKIMFDNRYEKNPAHLKIILSCIKSIEIDLKHTDSADNTLMSDYCSN